MSFKFPCEYGYQEVFDAFGAKLGSTGKYELNKSHNLMYGGSMITDHESLHNVLQSCLNQSVATIKFSLQEIVCTYSPRLFVFAELFC